MPRKKIYTTDKPGYEAVKAYRESKQIVRVPLDMTEEDATALREFCRVHDLSVAGFIRDLVREAIAAADPGQTPPVGGTGAGSGAGVTSPTICAEEKD